MTVVSKILSLLFYVFNISFILRSRDGYRIAGTKRCCNKENKGKFYKKPKVCQLCCDVYTHIRIVRYEFQSFSLQCKLSLALRLDAAKSLR